MSSRNDLPGTSITLHTMFIIVGGICMGLCTVVSAFNFVSHFVWRFNLPEQKQLMRLTFLPVFFSVFSWCSLVIYGLGKYLDPIPKLYEIYCVACFHHLMVQVLHPNEETREDFFIQAERMNRRARKQKHRNGSYRWYRVQSMFVHLVLFILAVFTIVEEVLVYKSCTSDHHRQIAEMVIQLLTVIFTIMAVISLLRIYIRFKSIFQGTKILRKFWTVKGFVFFYMIQSLIVSILKGTGSISSTKYMTMADFEYGVFEFIICCEGFLCSIFCVWSISALTYRPKLLNQHTNVLRTGVGPDAGVDRYLITFLFPKEVFVGFWLGLETFVRLPSGRKRCDYTAGTGVGWKERQDSGAYEPLADGAQTEDSDNTEYAGA